MYCMEMNKASLTRSVLGRGLVGGGSTPLHTCFQIWESCPHYFTKIYVKRRLTVSSDDSVFKTNLFSVPLFVILFYNFYNNIVVISLYCIFVHTVLKQSAKHVKIQAKYTGCQASPIPFVASHPWTSRVTDGYLYKITVVT